MLVMVAVSNSEDRAEDAVSSTSQAAISGGGTTQPRMDGGKLEAHRRNHTQLEPMAMAQMKQQILQKERGERKDRETKRERERKGERDEGREKKRNAGTDDVRMSCFICTL